MKFQAKEILLSTLLTGAVVVRAAVNEPCYGAGGAAGKSYNTFICNTTLEFQLLTSRYCESKVTNNTITTRCMCNHCYLLLQRRHYFKWSLSLRPIRRQMLHQGTMR